MLIISDFHQMTQRCMVTSKRQRKDNPGLMTMIWNGRTMKTRCQVMMQILPMTLGTFNAQIILVLLIPGGEASAYEKQRTSILNLSTLCTLLLPQSRGKQTLPRATPWCCWTTVTAIGGLCGLSRMAALVSYNHRRARTLLTFSLGYLPA